MGIERVVRPSRAREAVVTKKPGLDAAMLDDDSNVEPWARLRDAGAAGRVLHDVRARAGAAPAPSELR